VRFIDVEIAVYYWHDLADKPTREVSTILVYFFLNTEVTAIGFQGLA
jgi:hypothetical protein